MGGAVSSGRDNTELVDNLMGGNYIRSRDVEKVFRALDRGDYMTPDARDQAYKDLAWRNGPLHMSAPCIYSEVMEGLELKPGLSFLNVGSGTGYLSTLVGLVIGSSGINHGVEIHPVVVEYATKKLSQFLESSPTLDELDFCEPKYLLGNGLCLAPLQTPYDRVYCGAGCPEEYQSYFQQLIKIGGILVMPLNDNLLQTKRTGPNEWSTRSLLNVSFASLRVPTKEESADLIRLEEQTPVRLQVLARAVIRECMRGAMRRRHPQVREPPPRAPPAKRACPRRICIPVEDDDDSDDALNNLHDLDRASGAHEMNALLSLVLSMGHNRVAGALRVAPLDDETSSSNSSDQEDGAERISPHMEIREDRGEDSDDDRIGHNVLMFEFRDGNGSLRHANPPIPLRRPRLRRRPRRDDRDGDRDDRDGDRDDRDGDRDDRDGDRDDEDMDRDNGDAFAVGIDQDLDMVGDNVERRNREIIVEGKDDVRANRDYLEADRNDTEADRDDRERNREETERPEEEENNSTGYDEVASIAKEMESFLENKDATEDIEAKSDDTEKLEEVPLAGNEVVRVGVADDKERTPRDKKVKKERKGILKKTFKEKEVKNPLKDKNFKVSEIPLDDINTDNASAEESTSCYKQSTSGEEFSDATTPEKESLNHSNNTVQGTEPLDNNMRVNSKTAAITARGKEYAKNTDKLQREKEFLDCSDFSEKEARLKRSFRKARDANAKSKTRSRASRSSRRSSDGDEDQRNPEVPAEVEICLGKEAAGPSTMDWETSAPVDAEAKERSSGDEGTETEPSKTTEEKRHKLDSGIGEENTPSGGSASPDSEESDHSDDTEEDEGCDEDVRGELKRHKLDSGIGENTSSGGSASPDSEESDHSDDTEEDEGCDEDGRGELKRHKLHSGIGEENTPSGGSASPDSEESDHSDDTEEDEGCDEDVRGELKRHKLRSGIGEENTPSGGLASPDSEESDHSDDTEEDEGCDEDGRGELKCHKLHSGIGEENTPSGGSASPDSEESDHSDDTEEDEGCDEDGRGELKRHKLHSGIGEENTPSGGSASPDSEESDHSDDTEEDEGCDEDGRGELKCHKLHSGIGEENTPSGGSASPDSEESDHSDDTEEDEGCDEDGRGELKRHKLHSGIGEENTPSGGSASPDSEESDHSDDTEEDEGCDEDVRGRRRRRQKRGHLSTRSSSSTDEELPGPQRPRPRRRDTDSARRAQLSLLMKRGVKELPLPHALKKYVNLGRCFEF